MTTNRIVIAKIEETMSMGGDPIVIVWYRTMKDDIPTGRIFDKRFASTADAQKWVAARTAE